MSFTLADATVLGNGGTIAYESIGETDVNSPGWVSIAFGFDKPGRHDSGTWSGDFSIDRIDWVFDQRHAGKLIRPPSDFATWLTHLPGVRLAAPPTAVRVGGIAATQLDLVAGRAGVSIGPIPGVTDPPAFGFGPDQPARMIAVTIDGHHVLVTIGGVEGANHFARVVAALQPLVDSIAWQ